MFKGNYSCNRAVIFEVAVFLLLSLFWTNHNANHQTPSPQCQPPITFCTTTTTTTCSTTAFQRPQPHPHLNKPRHPHHFTHNRQHRHTTFSTPPTTGHATTLVVYIIGVEVAPQLFREQFEVIANEDWHLSMRGDTIPSSSPNCAVVCAGCEQPDTSRE